MCLAKRQYCLNNFSVESCEELFRVTDELLGKNATLPFPATSPDQLPSYFLDFFTFKITKIRENFDVSNENVQHPLFAGLYLSNCQAVSEDKVKSVLKNCPLKFENQTHPIQRYLKIFLILLCLPSQLLETPPFNLALFQTFLRRLL